MSSRSQNLPAAALAAVWLAALFTLPLALAQTPNTQGNAKVTVTVHNVATASGTIRGLLCPDPSLFGQNGCDGVRVEMPAKTGSVDLVFAGVAPGTYALSVSHDEDGDGRFNLFSEAFAFGNESRSVPPVFDEAALKVTGDLKTETTLFRFGQ